MTELRAWIRERLPLARIGPLALLLVWVGSLEPGRVPPTGLAILLIAVFRLRDDLADRSRDARLHPRRVLVRASSTRPFERATAIGLALAAGLLAIVQTSQHAVLLLALAGAFELAYRFDLPARHRWVLLKYPAFAALLGDVSPSTAALIYLSFAIFERADDPELRRRSDADLRLLGYLLTFVALAGLVLASDDPSWLAVLVGLWSFAAARAFAGRGSAIFLVLVFVCAIGALHARDPRLLLLW